VKGSVTDFILFRLEQNKLDESEERNVDGQFSTQFFFRFELLKRPAKVVGVDGLVVHHRLDEMGVWRK
jgi:hypothetical protein